MSEPVADAPEKEEPAPILLPPVMLLSRVAEHIYWAGRYLERAEGTARLVKTHTELFVDLRQATRPHSCSMRRPTS